ncbi:MAG TPA: methionyl-tRNA formyltransferase [Actinomycetota bacterium]
MRVVFFGTPEVAARTLEAVRSSAHEVVAVVTQPDRPRGRKGSPQPSEVKRAAGSLPVLQPESPKQDGFAQELAAFEPDALAVVAYGHILPRAVLAVAPAVNVHYSLLPAYRGAAPVQRALMDGAERTGVSVFLLEPTVDTGPVLAREPIEVGEEETAGEVLERLTPIGARLLVEVLGALARGGAEPQPQDDALASPAPKIAPHDRAVDWREPARAIVNRVRALSPRPGARADFGGSPLIVLRARRVSVGETTGGPGTVVSADPLVIAAGEEGVELVTVQLAGKRAMGGADFARGHAPVVGQPFGGQSARSG